MAPRSGDQAGGSEIRRRRSVQSGRRRDQYHSTQAVNPLEKEL